MSDQIRYATPAAFRKAVESRLKARASQPGDRTFAELRREFIYQRFLARVFSSAGDPLWVLKGGIGLLARLPGARYSQDIDLLHLSATPDAAGAELREIGRRRAGDHLRFEVSRIMSLSVMDALRLKMTAYLGTSVWDKFDVDVSLECHYVAQLEQVEPSPVLQLEGIDPLPTFQCYPIVDQVADKVGALYELHGENNAPSSRYRDLVDLVLIVRARALDAALLIQALAARRKHARNRIDMPTAIRVPGVGWETGYRAESRRSTLGAAMHDLNAALDQVAVCLDPILSGEVCHGTWSPERQRWS